MSEGLQWLDVSSQMSQQTARYFGPSDREVSCPKTSICRSDNEAAGYGKPEMSSYTVNGQIWRRQSMQTLVDHHCQFVQDVS